MKRLQNNFTTPEQSNRLLELGVPAWTADCYYYDMFDKHTKVSYIDANKDYKWNLESEYTPKPCWSVGRLMQIFAICFDPDFIHFDTFANGINFLQQMMDKFETYEENMDFSKLEE